MQPRLSVIIPVYNCWQLTENCLCSLRASVMGDFMEVIVVDNASHDETAAALPSLGKTLFRENFVLITNTQNEGFAKACNKGANAARAEMIFFLNNDTLLEPGWLAPLLSEFSANSRLGACGPLLLYPDTNRVQHLGIAFSPELATEHLYVNFPADHAAVGRRRNLQAITGAALMLPKELFISAGGFYEGYKNGFEDIDLCWQIRKLGKQLTVVPESRIIHLESQTPGRFEYDTANAELLNTRCMGAFAPDLHRHALRDGFALALTPWLELFVTLTPENMQAISMEFAPMQQQNSSTAQNKTVVMSPSHWLEGIQKEPLWEAGYELLGTFLEESGNFAEAAGLRLLQTSFSPSLPSYRALARAAAKANNSDLAEQALQKIEEINKRLEDVDTLLDKAGKLKTYAERANEPELYMLYNNWL